MWTSKMQVVLVTQHPESINKGIAMGLDTRVVVRLGRGDVGGCFASNMIHVVTKENFRFVAHMGLSISTLSIPVSLPCACV